MITLSSISTGGGREVKALNRVSGKRTDTPSTKGRAMVEGVDKQC